MDPTTLASATVALLAPFLPQLTGKFTEKAADRLAEGAVSAVHRLFVALKERLGGERYAEAQLMGLIDRPESPTRRQALEAALAEVLQDDKQFAKNLARLVTTAQQTVGPQMTLGSFEGTTAFGGEVHQQADYLAGRDMTINQRDIDPRG
jgi:hypothetical protein